MVYSECEEGATEYHPEDISGENFSRYADGFTVNHHVHHPLPCFPGFSKLLLCSWIYQHPFVFPGPPSLSLQLTKLGTGSSISGFSLHYLQGLKIRTRSQSRILCAQPCLLGSPQSLLRCLIQHSQQSRNIVCLNPSRSQLTKQELWYHQG